MLHTTVQFFFITPFTSWLQQGNQQRPRSVVDIAIEENKITIRCVHIHTHETKEHETTESNRITLILRVNYSWQGIQNFYSGKAN